MAQCYLSVGELSECRAALMAAVVSLHGEKDHKAYEELGEADFRSRYWRQRKLHSLNAFWRNAQGKGQKAKAAQPPGRDGAAAKRKEKPSPHLELAIAYELLAQVSMQEHCPEQAGYCAMRALDIGKSLPTITPVVGRAYASLMLVESASEKSSSWMVARYKRKALETCEKLNELGQLSYTLHAAGVHDAGQARWASAQDNLGQAAAYAAKLKDMRQWEESVCHQAHMEFYHGRFALSKDLYAQALQSAQKRGDNQIEMRCNAGIAGALLVANDIEGALSILQSPKGKSNGQLALALLRSGRHEEALAKAMLLMDRFKGKRTKYYVLKAYASTAEVILKLLEEALSRRASISSAATSPDDAAGGGATGGATGSAAQDAAAGAATGTSSPVRLHDPESLTRLAEEWTDKLAQFGNIYPVAKPRALLLRGQLLVVGALGSDARRKQGLQTFRASLATARQLTMPYDEGLAEYELGKHGDTETPGQVAARHKHLQNAQELFEQCGAAYDVQRCRLQLKRVSTAGAADGGGGAAKDASPLHQRGDGGDGGGDFKPRPTLFPAAHADAGSEHDDDDGEDTWRVGAHATEEARKSRTSNNLDAVSEDNVSLSSAASATSAPSEVKSYSAIEAKAKAGVRMSARERYAAEGCSMGCGSEPNSMASESRVPASARPALGGATPGAQPPTQVLERDKSASDRTHKKGQRVEQQGSSLGALDDPMMA